MFINFRWFSCTRRTQKGRRINKYFSNKILSQSTLQIISYIAILSCFVHAIFTCFYFILEDMSLLALFNCSFVLHCRNFHRLPSRRKKDVKTGTLANEQRMLDSDIFGDKNLSIVFISFPSGIFRAFFEFFFFDYS